MRVSWPYLGFGYYWRLRVTANNGHASKVGLAEVQFRECAITVTTTTATVSTSTTTTSHTWFTTTSSTTTTTTTADLGGWLYIYWPHPDWDDDTVPGEPKGGMNVRYVIPPDLLFQNGDQFKVKFGWFEHDWEIYSAWIGQPDEDQPPYFFDGNQKQLFFSGAEKSGVIGSGGKYSDALYFDVDKTRPLVVSIYFPTPQPSPKRKSPPPTEEYQTWWARGRVEAQDGVVGVRDDHSGMQMFVEEAQVHGTWRTTTTTTTATYPPAEWGVVHDDITLSGDDQIATADNDGYKSGRGQVTGKALLDE